MVGQPTSSNLSSVIQLLWGLRHFVKVLRRLFLFGSAKINLLWKWPGKMTGISSYFLVLVSACLLPSAFGGLHHTLGKLFLSRARRLYHLLRCGEWGELSSCFVSCFNISSMLNHRELVWTARTMWCWTAKIYFMFMFWDTLFISSSWMRTRYVEG